MLEAFVFKSDSKIQSSSFPNTP
uniref:Uncharacterized protein n=1 Tax=Anguilla anguilla TaxID=7936 RepID=A0A0E9UZ83_ANGAN